MLFSKNTIPKYRGIFRYTHINLMKMLNIKFTLLRLLASLLVFGSNFENNNEKRIKSYWATNSDFQHKMERKIFKYNAKHI